MIADLLAGFDIWELGKLIINSGVVAVVITAVMNRKFSQRDRVEIGRQNFDLEDKKTTNSTIAENVKVFRDCLSESKEAFIENCAAITQEIDRFSISTKKNEDCYAGFKKNVWQAMTAMTSFRKTLELIYEFRKKLPGKNKDKIMLDDTVVEVFVSRLRIFEKMYDEYMGTTNKKDEDNLRGKLVRWLSEDVFGMEILGGGDRSSNFRIPCGYGEDHIHRRIDDVVSSVIECFSAVVLSGMIDGSMCVESSNSK